MELKDCLIFNNAEAKGKIVIPKDCIKSLKTAIRRDYSANADKEVTVLMIDIDFAELLGIDTRHAHRKDKVFPIDVADELTVVMGMIGASKGAAALFGKPNE